MRDYSERWVMKSNLVVWGALLVGTGTVQAQAPEVLSPDDFQVVGVTEETDSSAIRALLGPPDSVVVQNPSDDQGLTTIYYPDLIISFGYSDTPIGFMLTGPGVETYRGLRVGETRDRVRQLYGDAPFPHHAVWEFTDPTDPDGLHLIQVQFAGSRVDRIYVGWMLD